MTLSIPSCLAGLWCFLPSIKLVEDGYNITKGPQLGISRLSPHNLLFTMFSYFEEHQVHFAITPKAEHQATQSNENRQWNGLSSHFKILLMIACSKNPCFDVERFAANYMLYIVTMRAGNATRCELNRIYLHVASLWMLLVLYCKSAISFCPHHSLAYKLSILWLPSYSNMQKCWRQVFCWLKYTINSLVVYIGM